MENDELYRDLEQALTAFPETVASFGPDQLNKVPFEGSWTAGQVAEHMILANSSFAELVTGPVSDTERQPDEKINDIRAAFLNFDIKFKSPEFVLPTKDVHDKEELLDALDKLREAILEAVEEGGLDKTCTGRDVPALGYVTRLEALHFVLVHTQRHIHQLKNIRQSLVQAFS